MNAEPSSRPSEEAATEMEARLRGFFQSENAAGVDSAYLFGGHAAGRAHRQSDVDVAVLLSRQRYPDRASRFDRRLQLTADLIAHLHRNDVDLVVLNDVRRCSAGESSTKASPFAVTIPRPTTSTSATSSSAPPTSSPSSGACDPSSSPPSRRADRQ
jgi:predicted nucleotidyltransferase